MPIVMSFRAHSDKHHNFSIEEFAISSKNSFFSLNVDPLYIICEKTKGKFPGEHHAVLI